MMNIITVQDLCLWYGSHQALKDINIDIPEKSITALIGPSGCGKSTFLKTLNRMNDLIPDVKITGSVKYRDADIFDPTTDVNELRRQIGMVFQSYDLFPNMTILNNLLLAPMKVQKRNKEEVKKEAEQLLDRVGLLLSVTKQAFRRSETASCHCTCHADASGDHASG